MVIIHYLRYSAGFLIASLVQAGIVFLTESMNISALNARLTFGQLIVHIIVGQVAGYILWYAMKKVDSIRKINVWAIGIVYGIVLWFVVLPIASAQGTVVAPWTQGFATIISSMIAFAAYGIISSYTIKEYEKIETE